MLKLFLCLVLVMSSTHAARVLILPLPMYSHCIEQIGIGKELVKRGHSIVAFVPSNFKTSCFDNVNVTLIRYQASEQFNELQERMKTSFIEIAFKGELPNTNLESLINVAKVPVALCMSALTSVKAMKQLKDMNITFALVDSFLTAECLFYITSYLNVSTASVGPEILLDVSSRPLQSNTNPFLVSTNTAEMTLPQRVANTLVNVMFHCTLKGLLFMFGIDKGRLKGFLPDEILNMDTGKLARNSLLYIENADDIIDYPKAIYQNLIRVGGLSTEPAKPLPKEMEQFFSRAKNGVIVVSFGSMHKGAPPPFFEKLNKIFKKLNHSVIMAYTKDSEDGNVRTAAWLPQNDVLGHPNTVLFISHCGKNGLNEGFYHGVPILCTPFHSDQLTNSRKVEYHRIGSLVDIVNSNEDTILKAINDTLNDKTFRENMKRLSRIFHGALFTPQERAVNALEHVFKYGGAHLRPVSADLSFVSKTMMDVWFIIYTIAIAILYIEYRLIKCCYTCICCRKRSAQKKKKE